MSRTLPLLTAFSTRGNGASTKLGLSAAAVGPPAPRGAVRRFLLLKYIQILLLPQANELLLAVGALASLYTLLLLSSQCFSRKASTVLLGQLAWADGLLLLRWSLGLESGLWLGDVRLSLGCGAEATPGLVQGLLLEGHHLASLLLLSCVSLEALLVSRWAAMSRHVRTVQHARLACTLIWIGVAMQLGLQVVGRFCTKDLWEVDVDVDGERQLDTLEQFVQVCCTLAPLSYALTQGVQAVLWLMNTWVLFIVFYGKTQKSKSCYH